MASSISALSAVNSYGSTAGVDGGSRLPNQTLGQDDFLRLLVTQMTSQDPMNPMSDTSFIAQMAQFSALEQSRTMSSDMAQLRADQQILQANSMLGCVVTVQGSNGIPVSGTVDAVTIEAGTPLISVNGQNYDLSSVLEVKLPQIVSQ